jgi:glycosyltransferase involved in cell wall biosynthesis
LTGTTRERLKIVYLGHTAALSGGEIGLARLIRASEHVQAHVILAEFGPLVDELEDAGATVEVLPLAAGVRHIRREQLGTGGAALGAVGSVYRYARRLEWRLRKLGPDLVHSNTLKSGVYGVMAARLARLPIVWGLHDRIARDYLPAPAVAPMRLLVSTAPNALVVPSQATLDTVGPWFRPGLRRAVIPLPVWTPTLEYHVREEVKVIGLIGRLAGWKGQDVFLRAFAHAFGAGEVRARIVGSALFGEDDYAASLPVLARELGIADRVDFVGFSSDIPGELAGMDIVVNASVLPETLGQTIIEAMGAGVPTIAARAGGPLEYVEDGVSGLLHDPGDVASLAGAMGRLSADVALRRSLSHHGRQVAARFSPAHTSADMLRLYGDVAKV